MTCKDSGTTLCVLMTSCTLHTYILHTLSSVTLFDPNMFRPTAARKRHGPSTPVDDAPVHAQGDNTALHWAAMRGHVEIVAFLVASDADRTLRNRQDKLPIDLCQPTWSHAYRYTREVLA